MSVSILTLNKNRDTHLKHLIEGLARCDDFDGELIIVKMSRLKEEMPRYDFSIKYIDFVTKELPLASARNEAAKLAIFEKMIFLDVDCIPSKNFVKVLKKALDDYDALISPKILYLPQGVVSPFWQEKTLQKLGKAHEARDFPVKGYKLEKNPGLFWSLAFAIHKKNFQKIGHFCEDYKGYGGEDTDFGFRAQALGVDHFLTSECVAYHQYHESFDPPFQHFVDIITNAKTFYQKWGEWPMPDWLAAFQERNLIHWHDNEIHIINTPKPPY